MLKKMSIIILALVLGLFSYQAFAVAMQKDDSTVEPQYTHIATMGGSFDIKTGTAICCGTGRSRYAETTTVVKVTLQKRAANSKVWVPVCSWSETATGKETVRVNEEKIVSSGYDYRIYIKCTIKDSSGEVKETDGMYSRIVSY